MTLKYLSNSWKALDTPLINCEVSLTLTWSENCVITSKTTREAHPDSNLAVAGINNPTNAVFKTTDCKLYVPGVTLYYLIDPKFTKVNRLFVLSFENETDRTSFSKYYVPKFKIKDFNVLIHGKLLSEIHVQNKEEAYEQIIEISKNNNYTTGNFLNYKYFKDHYKLIAIDLSEQIELENPDLKQQINFTGRLEEDNGAMFFIIETKEETAFDFS